MTNNVEDALDDLVDGKVQAVAIERVASEACTARKPGRFQQLKPVIKSKPYPGVVIAYYDETLNANTLHASATAWSTPARRRAGKPC